MIKNSVNFAHMTEREEEGGCTCWKPFVYRDGCQKIRDGYKSIAGFRVRMGVCLETSLNRRTKGILHQS